MRHGKMEPWERKALNIELASKRQWVTNEGKTLDMSSMGPNHIRNCMRLLERNKPPAYQLLITEFQRELDMRGEDMPPSPELEDKYRKLAEIARDLLVRYEREAGPIKAATYKRMLKDIGIEA